MGCINKKLVGILVVQVGLAAITWWPKPKGAQEGDRPLIDLNLEQVEQLIVSSKPAKGEEAKPVHLAKKDGSWVVASASDFPAKADKVEEVVKKILGLRVGTPIAKQRSNHNALHVGEREYDKLVTLTGGGKSTTVVIGSAKGSNAHVRIKSEDKVYWVKDLSTWALKDSLDSYIETEFFKIEDPKKVEVTNDKGLIELAKNEAGEWVLANIPPGQTSDSAKVDSFVRSIAKLRLSEPVGSEVKPEYGLQTGTRVVLTDKEDKTHTYRIGAEKDGKFYVQVDGQATVVLAPKWAVDAARTQEVSKLLANSEEGDS